MKQKLMTDHLRKRILYSVGIKVSSYRSNNPKHSDTIIKMLASNKVICYKCGCSIEPQTFYNSTAPGGRISKYYHPECMDSLYQ